MYRHDMFFMGPIFWFLVIVGVVLLVRWLTGSRETGNNDQVRGSALDILDKRYARGEIDRHEYEQIKKDLEP